MSRDRTGPLEHLAALFVSDVAPTEPRASLGQQQQDGTGVKKLWKIVEKEKSWSSCDRVSFNAMRPPISIALVTPTETVSYTSFRNDLATFQRPRVTDRSSLLTGTVGEHHYVHTSRLRGARKSGNQRLDETYVQPATLASKYTLRHISDGVGFLWGTEGVRVERSPINRKIKRRINTGNRMAWRT